MHTQAGTPLKPPGLMKNGRSVINMMRPWAVSLSAPQMLLWLQLPLSPPPPHLRPPHPRCYCSPVLVIVIIVLLFFLSIPAHTLPPRWGRLSCLDCKELTLPRVMDGGRFPWIYSSFPLGLHLGDTKQRKTWGRDKGLNRKVIVKEIWPDEHLQAGERSHP